MSEIDDYERNFTIMMDFPDSDSDSVSDSGDLIQEPEVVITQPTTQLIKFKENTVASQNEKYANIEDMTNEQILSLSTEFIKAYRYNKEVSTIDFIDICMAESGIRPNDLYNQSIIYEKFKIKMHELKFLKYNLTLRNLSERNYDEFNTYNTILSNLMIVIGNSMHLLLSLRQSLTALKPNYDTSMSDDQRILSVAFNDTNEMKDPEILICYTLSYIQRMGYRKYGEFVYKPIYKGTHFTHSWEPLCEIKEFVHSMVDKDENRDIWKILYTRGGYHNLINFLKECREYEFPEIKKDRNIFSFTNGVYNSKEHKFYDYNDAKLSTDIVASKYHNLPFNYIADRDAWESIPTPHFQSILDYQFIDEAEHKEICKIAYIMIGRMLYDTGDLEDWQVIPFFKGFAMTGKSTILRFIIKRFYEACDVGTLSNECAEKFPLENIYEKKVFISPDINEKFGLPQMTFQSMISGEDVSVMRKGIPPIDVEWKIPGALAGNEFFGYRDNGGSIGRRIVLFEFMNPLSKEQLDSNLSHYIKLELPNILQKCNMAYLQAVRDFPRQNIWANLPKYFHDNRAYLLEQTNSLIEFLNSDMVSIGKTEYIQKDEFVQAYMAYCKENGLRPKKFNKDFYSSPFAISGNKHNVKIAVKRNPEFGDIKKKGNFIVGLNIKYNSMETDESIAN